MKSRNYIIALIGLLAAACDGSDSAPAPVNLAPVISTIPDQSTVANHRSAPIAFSVTDEQTAGLGITASSDNQQLAPDSGLELGGSGAQRTLKVTPAIDTLGDAFISIDVTDQQGLMASTVFLLTIDPQQASMQQSTRTWFAESADDEPDLVNAVEFLQDADDDDFTDLLAQ